MIEFREIDGVLKIFKDGWKSGVEINDVENGGIVLDPVCCTSSFTVQELEAILAKMKELQGENKS